MVLPEEEVIKFDWSLKDKGICPACRVAIADHAKCESCGALLGEKHTYNGMEYRRHLLCDACIKRWIDRENKSGRKLSFQEMIASRTR